ncbi:hypothetical protein LINGRAHAP2_LOCUS35233, partial [Linum grandiflorum]
SSKPNIKIQRTNITFIHLTNISYLRINSSFILFVLISIGQSLLVREQDVAESTSSLFSPSNLE